jgi:flavin reductase (DIM6/NTAB) family NADH-FMN oxidoreductase RutF
VTNRNPPFTRYLTKTVKLLNDIGLLLVSGTIKKANVMTIGWGLPGILWGKPFFMVAVRPSRYTFEFIEKIGDFTVNVPSERGMDEIVDYCGTVSGRDHDKFKEKGLTLLPSKKVRAPIIAECPIHYECKVAFKTQLTPQLIPKDVALSYYAHPDYHTLYFGEIVATYAAKSRKA